MINIILVDIYYFIRIIYSSNPFNSLALYTEINYTLDNIYSLIYILEVKARSFNSEGYN